MRPIDETLGHRPTKRVFLSTRQHGILETATKSVTQNKMFAYAYEMIPAWKPYAREGGSHTYTPKRA